MAATGCPLSWPSVDPLEIIVERDGHRREVRLQSTRLTVGRGADADLRLDDPLVSRLHCEIQRLGEDVFVVDLDSANGTWVDGVRIQRRPLAAGAVVRVGSTLLHVGGRGCDPMAAVEATRTEDQSREQELLDTFLGLVRNIHEEEQPERLAALLVDAAVSLTRAERGFLFLVEQGRTSLALGRNFAREPVPAPEQKVSRTLLGRALEADRVLLLRDAASDGQFAGVASISDLGLRALMAAPLRYHGDVLGLLVVDHRLAPGAFRQEEAAILDAAARVAAWVLGSLRDRRRLAGLRRTAARLQRQLGRKVRVAREEEGRELPAAATRFPGILGASPAMQRLFEAMERILDSDVTVLVQGESGTGKELVARALHHAGRRAGRAFVTENCGALPDTLLESELFGHVKGAYTGATRNRAGRFEAADGGTLFLDEVGEMSQAMQARLLRALQEGEIRRLGSDEVIQVDVRVIAASNVDLWHLVQEGRFREDLYYRLKVVQFDLPPLRERKGDVALLCRHFLAVEATEQGREPRSLTPEALALLERYPWPGNVRQLRNEMRRLTLLGEGPVEPADLPEEIRHAEGSPGGDPGPERPLPERLAALEKQAILEAVEAARGNRSEAARRLGISRFSLLRKVEKYGLAPGEDPGGER